MPNRVLVVGWDGADWDILDPLLAAGELPALGALLERSRRGVSRSSLPTHSWAAWPTFLTGRDPAASYPGARRQARLSADTTNE